VSGAGQAGVDDYRAGMSQTGDRVSQELKKFPYPIFNNLIPHIDSFLPNGNTKEEEKMVFETRKILHRPDLAVTATTVRVPIENCHSIAINAEFERTPDIENVKKLLKNAPGVVLYDDPAKNIYPMPMVANDRNEVFVGRVRPDASRPNTINLFTVSDNIRKGAATNAVQILKLLI
jgi:aspartate-semialdehyde dehydrogenase